MTVGPLRKDEIIPGWKVNELSGLASGAIWGVICSYSMESVLVAMIPFMIVALICSLVILSKARRYLSEHWGF